MYPATGKRCEVCQVLFLVVVRSVFSISDEGVGKPSVTRAIPDRYPRTGVSPPSPRSAECLVPENVQTGCHIFAKFPMLSAGQGEVLSVQRQASPPALSGAFRVAFLESRVCARRTTDITIRQYQLPWAAGPMVYPYCGLVCSCVNCVYCSFTDTEVAPSGRGLYLYNNNKFGYQSSASREMVQ